MGNLVAQVTGVHYFDLGAPVTLHVHPGQVYVFGENEALLLAPRRVGGV
jgi:glycerol transport system ATP-binding protein